jgi:hypothetical protein
MADGATYGAKLAPNSCPDSTRFPSSSACDARRNLQRELHRPLGAIACPDRDQIRVELTGADCDPITVRCLVDEITSGDSAIAPEVVEVEAALDATVTGQFLRGFEDLTRSAQES